MKPMTAETDLLPLPEMGHFEQRYAGIPYQVRTAYTADQIEPSPECPGVVAERAAARAEALRDCADELEAALAAREGGAS